MFGALPALGRRRQPDGFRRPADAVAGLPHGVERGHGFAEVAERLLDGARLMRAAAGAGCAGAEAAPSGAGAAPRGRPRARRGGLARSRALLLCDAAAADARRPRLELPRRRRDEHRQRRRLPGRCAARGAHARRVATRAAFVGRHRGDRAAAGAARRRGRRRGAVRAAPREPGSASAATFVAAACSPRAWSRQPASDGDAAAAPGWCSASTTAAPALGIVVAALLVPPLARARAAHAWQAAWIGARRRRRWRPRRSPRCGHPPPRRRRRRRRRARRPVAAPFAAALARLLPLRPRLHRLHDVRRHAAARAGPRARRRSLAFYVVLGAGGHRVVVAVGARCCSARAAAAR